MKVPKNMALMSWKESQVTKWSSINLEKQPNPGERVSAVFDNTHPRRVTSQENTASRERITSSHSQGEWRPIVSVVPIKNLSHHANDLSPSVLSIGNQRTRPAVQKRHSIKVQVNVQIRGERSP